MKSPRPRTLAITLLAGLTLAGGVIAQSAEPTPAQQKELDAARAELDGAAKRYAELARKYHPYGDMPMKLEQRLLRKPVLGVLLAPDEAAGVRIAGVTPESAAAEAGLRAGDRLTTIDGKAFSGADADARLKHARTLLADLDAKHPVRIGYARDQRETTVAVTPKLNRNLMLWDAKDGKAFKFDDDMRKRLGELGAHDFEFEGLNAGAFAGIAPQVRTEIIRLGPDGKCEGERCKLPMLAEAFRWSGLNLASVDPQLGRYFGTEEGVLVLSTGGELAGLQAGDVVQKIDGKPVESPREAMAALRAKPADSSVRVDYLRDHRSGTAQVKVPKATPFRIPAPPAPPAPPPPPPVPSAAATPPAPPAAPPPHAPRMVERRKIVTVDQDGNRHEWEDDSAAPLPEGARRIEQRRMVFVDDDGRTTVLEGDDAPPPPPPPAPPPPPPSPAD